MNGLNQVKFFKFISENSKKAQVTMEKVNIVRT